MYKPKNVGYSWQNAWALIAARLDNLTQTKEAFS